MNKEEIELIKKELEVWHEKLDKIIKEYEVESKEWKPKHDEKYWFADNDLNADYFYYTDERDEEFFKYNKIFKTEEEAQEYADYLKAIANRTYKFSKEEWENDTLLKWNIKYGNEDKCFEIENSYITNCFNKFTFKTKEEARAFIDEYGSMILKYEM